MSQDNDTPLVWTNPDEPEGNGLVSKARRHRPFVLLLILILVLGLIFFKSTSTKPHYEDSIGYIYAGERLAQGQGPTYEDPNNEFAGPYFAMYAFQIRRDDDSRMYLGYPPGYPLLIALGIIATGTNEAAHFVVPLLAMTGLAATYFLGQMLSGREWVGFWAAILMGLAPLFWEFGTAAWSEIPSTAFLISGICLYLFSLKTQGARRRVVILSFLAGVLISFSFFIRYSNVVILPAILAYEALSKKSSLKNVPERWIFYAILGIGIIGILLFNTSYYGGPFVTSYSPEHGWYPYPPFSVKYIFGPSFVGGRSMIEAVKTLWINFPGLLILVPVGWFILPRPSGALVALATLGFFGLYSIYAFAPTGINGRFLIPAFPFVAVSLAQCINFAGQKLRSRSIRRAAGFALFLLLFIRVPGQVNALENRVANNESSFDYAKNIANRTEEEAVIMTYLHNDQLAYHGNRSVLNYRRIPDSDPVNERFRLEMLEPCLVASVDRLLQRGLPVYYIEDRSPPFWNSLAILHDNYVLEMIAESPTMYRVSSTGERTMSVGEMETFSCGNTP